MTIESVLDEVLEKWVHQGHIMLQKKFPGEKAEPKVAFFNISHACKHPAWVSYNQEDDAIMLNHLRLEQFYHDEGRERTVALLTYLILGTFMHQNDSWSDRKVMEVNRQLMDAVLPHWRLLLGNRLNSLKQKGLDHSFVV